MRTSPGAFCCPDFVFLQLCGVPQRIHRPAILLQGLQQHHLPDLHGSRRQGKFRQPAFGPVVPGQSDMGHPGPVLHGYAPPPQFRLETQRPRFQLRIRPQHRPTRYPQSGPRLLPSGPAAPFPAGFPVPPGPERRPEPPPKRPGSGAASPAGESCPGPARRNSAWACTSASRTAPSAAIAANRRIRDTSLFHRMRFVFVFHPITVL